MAIRITIEIIPNGFEPGRRIVSGMVIANDGTEHGDRGNYDVAFFGACPMSGTMGERVKDREVLLLSAKVRDFPRRRANLWDFLYRALRRWHRNKSQARLKDPDWLEDAWRRALRYEDERLDPGIPGREEE